ncbi:MAG TPA: hypothetical protein VMU93_14530 [Caulobacteraceae bacterium]|nr:hypothetical protein [Caulobacteraceae bacterium]
MTAKPPPIPKEQRSFQGDKPDISGEHAPPAERANLKTHGRQANIRQNLRPQRQVQDR